MITYFDNENSLANELKKVESLEIFNNGKTQKITSKNHEFKDILNKLEELFAAAHLMPAFGVSLHHETQNAMLTDLWLKINFRETLTKNSLTFSALIFKLEKTSGFNLIREQNDKFEGRCLFLGFERDVDLKEILCGK